MQSPKKKIAILGGGLAGMTTAYALSDPKNANKFEVTVYQLGWRLGGKGASGRNIEQQMRIEEHGLHLWFGYYDNAFRVIKDCYEENNRPLTTPLATWQEAFKPYNLYVMTEEVKGNYLKWPVFFPANDKEPGDHSKTTLLDFVTEAMKLAFDTFVNTQGLFSDKGKKEYKINVNPLAEFKTIFDALPFNFQEPAKESSIHWMEIPSYLLKEIEKGDNGIILKFADEIIALLERFLQILGEYIDETVVEDTVLRRAWVTMDLTIVLILGFLRYDILRKGLSSINDYDYKEWLRKNGASELTINSPLVGSIYSYFFSTQNSLEAGTAINIVKHLLMD